MMKIISIFLFLLSSIFVFPLFGANELAKETSPYLLQHASNPVNWMPWSKKAFLDAKKEHKPIYVSIGYSTCHWCHIMEKESFTNAKIAALLNKYFICVKVDREELPHIDALYQNIYKTYTKHSGGWPLNVFMTPERKVFYITTYIPPVNKNYAQGFETLLPKLHKLYLNKKELHKTLLSIEHPNKSIKRSAKIKTALSYTKYLKNIYNVQYPGFGSSKQFPEASKISLMLDLAELEDDEVLKKEYFTLLDTMALRGLYDQIDGGFFRYCIDREWEIPHFEKMLYTQAKLLALYTRAYALTKKNLYKKVVQESIAMLDKRFLFKNLYFSASDADSEGEEGEYFTFTQAEITKAIRNNPYAQKIEDALGFTLAGNINNKIHLNFYTKKRPQGFKHFRANLKKIRASKKYPFIDKKINTAWNAMMIETLYKAAYIDTAYAKKADKHLARLKALMFKNNTLYHQTIPNHTPQQKGLLEDYAFFIGALISSYESNYNEKNLSFAEYLLSQAREKFYKNSVWYLSENLLIPANLNDKYYTSALAKMLQNIIKLAALKESFRYEKFAKKIFNSLRGQHPFSSAFTKAYLMQEYGVVVLKSKSSNLIKNYKTIQQIKYPYLLTLKKDYNDYLACTLRKCFAKDKTLKKVISKINTFQKNLLYNSH